MGTGRQNQFLYIGIFFFIFSLLINAVYANADCSLRLKSFKLGGYRPTLNKENIGIWRWDNRLKLTGPDGVLRMGFMGTGSAFSNLKPQSNFVVFKGDNIVWVDLGTRASHRMAEFQLSVNDIDNIIITHAHADHVGSIEELAFKAKYQRPQLGKRPVKPNLYIPEPFIKELWNETLKGGMEKTSEGLASIEDFFFLYKAKPMLNAPFKGWTTSVGHGVNKIKVTFFLVNHISANPLPFFTVGLVIDEKILISGDSQFDPKLLETILNYYPTIETIFHDAQSTPSKVHASIDQLATLPKEIKRRMFLYHTDDGMTPELIKKSRFRGAAKAFPAFYEWKK